MKAGDNGNRSVVSLESGNPFRGKNAVKNKMSRRSRMKHRILSEDSLGCDERLPTDAVTALVREIIENRIPSLSIQLLALPNSRSRDDLSWRGWIVMGEIRPIALLTSDTVLKKEKTLKKTLTYDVEEDILRKLISTASEGEYGDRNGSVSVMAVKNIKVKVKPYELTDLERYDTKIRQASGTSLFKEDKTGLRRGNTPEVQADITAKYDLPDVYKEEGSQASSTHLRIFKATVTLRKQPICSLNERARERLFLMFSPSDDNVLDIMNNAQIKNKMLRHEISKYLKPRKASKTVKVDRIENAAFYKKRRIASLVPVTQPGILKNYPPLTPELLFDEFFKENEIVKDGYTILVKEQPLLVENITVCEVPKETVTSLPVDEKTGFVPRYTFKDRAGENVPEEEQVHRFPRSLKSQNLLVNQKIDQSESSFESNKENRFFIESIVSGRLCDDLPELRDNMDLGLDQLSRHLREKPSETLPDDVTEQDDNAPDGAEETPVDVPAPPVKVKSKWDKILLAGGKAHQGRETVLNTYDEIAKELREAEEAELVERPEKPEKLEKLPPEESAVSEVSGARSTVATSILSAVPEELSVVEEEDWTDDKRPDIGKIMQVVKANKTRLKKDVIIPVIKPQLPRYQSSGKKRFYLTDTQQYWGEYHTDVNTFYHNPIQQSTRACKQPVINDDRLGAPFIPRFYEEEEEEEKKEDGDSQSHYSRKNQPATKKLRLPPPAPIITPGQVDEIKHELGSPIYTYSEDKTAYAGLAPSTYYNNSKKEIVALSYCERFLKNFYKTHEKRRKLFICVENELGVQKIVSTTIKPTGLPYKELDTWQAISKFVANNVTYVPLENPLYLPHVLSSPSLVLEKGRGHPFEISTLLVSLLIGQGYDAYVVSGYANCFLSLVESSRNYLQYDCPYLVSEGPTDQFQTFTTKSRVIKEIEKAKKLTKQSSSYHPTVAPYLDSSYHRQVKIDNELAKEEEARRVSREEEENACKRYQSFYEADELEGQRLHSWVLVLSGLRNVQDDFFLEPSSGFAYSPDDPHYYGIESLWNHQNYWINRNFPPSDKKDEEPKEKSDEAVVESQEDKSGFDLANNEIWLPLMVNGPQIFKEDGTGKKKAEIKARIARLQKSLDMPFSWCARISITTNQVERRISEPFRTSLYKRAVCHEFQVGINESGLTAKVIKFSDLPRTDPEYEVQIFEKRRDLMYRRRRDMVSDKLTEYFVFGRNDCLQSHEYIDGADAMYCDHNLYFYWDFRDDGLISMQMTDLYLKLSYAGRVDQLTSVLVLYGSSIEDGKKSKRKGADTSERGKTPRKEITMIVQQFDPSPNILPWEDVAKVTYRLTKGQIIVDYQHESSRVTVTTKCITKGHDDPELGQAVAEIAKKKRNKDDDEDNLSELDMENFDKELDKDSESDASSEGRYESASSKSKLITGTHSDRKFKKGDKRGSIASKKSYKERNEKETDVKKTKKTEGRTSEESIRSTKSSKSSKSSISEGSFGISDLECSSGDEKSDLTSFYPVNLVCDKDKSLWACSRKTRRFLGRKLLNSLFQPVKKVVYQSNDASANLIHETSVTDKISDFGHLTKDSSAESSDEEEEYLKELRKRQIKAISETNELYKAIERDEANPNIDSITGSGKSRKLQLCKLEHLMDHANRVEEDKKLIQLKKNKINERLHKQSLFYPNQKVKIDATDLPENVNGMSHVVQNDLKEPCICDSDSTFENDSVDSKPKEMKTHLSENNVLKIKSANSGSNTADKQKENVDPTSNYDLILEKENVIDPLIVGIYTDTDRCLDDSVSPKKKRPFARTEAKMKNIFNAVKVEMSKEKNVKEDESENQSISFKKEVEGTLSEEEAANEKDIDSLEGDVYNSDDNYSLQSKNASSSECPSSDDVEEAEDETAEEKFSCHSENESIIEYQTDAPKHQPYDFQGFHFHAGKMYARKLYQQKQVCDNVAIDSDHQSSYDGDEDYAAEYLQGEIDKFLENTVDRITQDVREARNLIGGLKKGSDTNIEQTGVYYCNLSDRYINYVDSYFKKINKKRELQSDKAFLMEMLKQRAKEPDKIIKHIREYIVCKKNGMDVELDENLMNLIPHVRPVQVKKKDRLGYEILTDDDDDDDDDIKVSIDEEQVPKQETQRESIEPVNITTAELVERLGPSPNVGYLMDAVNNLKKFKDMETVNQLIELPLHECFSDVNIRNHLQKTKVNDGYFIDAKIDGQVRQTVDSETQLGFVTDPEHILLSKEVESPPSSLSESDEEEQEIKLKHMEILTTCGKETIKEADFFEPIYNLNDKYSDPFRPVKFRMFAPIDPKLLDSDSDGSINTRIKEKRRKAVRPSDSVTSVELQQGSATSVVSAISTFSAVPAEQRLELDRTFGLEPIQQKTDGSCRVGVKNMSMNDEVSHVDKAITLENFLSMEDEVINYIRNMEAYIHNLLITRKNERKSTKRSIQASSRKGVRRSNFKVLQKKLAEFDQMADEVSFDCDLLAPYLHLLLPQDNRKKFTQQTSAYIMRLLIVDHIERELFKLKELYLTYENARQNVVVKKNMYASKLENLSFTDKGEFEKAVHSFNDSLRRIADQAHILRFVILRRAKQSTKKFIKLMNAIKKDERINQAFSEARERITLLDLSKRWPEHFEFIYNFSGLPVASEANDFTSSYISPVDDIIIKKILKQVRKKPAKYILTENAYKSYLDLMERDREYFEGMRNVEANSTSKQRRSIHSIYLGEKIDLNIDGKNSDFIDKLEIVNDLEWGDFFFVSESDEEIQQSKARRSTSISEESRITTFEVCTKSLVEELLLIQRIESASRTSSLKRKTVSGTVMFEEAQFRKDQQFFEKYGTPQARELIQNKLPEYFEYI